VRPNAGGGEFAGSQPMNTAVHNVHSRIHWLHCTAHGAQINDGDLSPYLTYGCWDRIQEFFTTFALAVIRVNHKARSRPHLAKSYPLFVKGLRKLEKKFQMNIYLETYRFPC
jgi:hypothetical protein